MKTYKERLKELLENRVYLFSVLAATLLGYGYGLTHHSVDVDDLEGVIYTGSGNVMLAAGRFGMKLWSLLRGGDMGFYAYADYVTDFLAIFFFLLAVVQFSILFRRVTRDGFTIPGAAVFSGLLLSYPLMNEIWEYNGANLQVCGGYFLDAAVVYLMYELLHRAELPKAQKALRFGLCALLMMVVCSSYESMAAVYVLTVFAVLFLQCLSEDKKALPLPKLIAEGVGYALPLGAGLVLRAVGHRLVLMLFHLERISNGNTTIYWFSQPVGAVVRSILVGFWDLLQAFFLYFPITVLLLTLLLFGLVLLGITIARKDLRLLLMGTGMMVSVFLLSLIQGAGSYYRTCQTYGLFVALVLSLCWQGLSRRNRGRLLSRIAMGLLVLLCLRQGILLSALSALNYERSEIEKNVIQTIGTDLERKNIHKNIVFVGEYPLPETVTAPVTRSGDQLAMVNTLRRWNGSELRESVKFVEGNVNSVINWAVHAWDEDGGSVERLFHYYGYEITAERDKQLLAEGRALAEAKRMPAYPQDGYILEAEDYVMIRLG